MNYRKVYMAVIDKAFSENRKRLPHGVSDYVYYEKHHILPKAIFPLWKNRKSNMVLLTAREHYFCHQLLTKIYPNQGMFYAVYRMTHDKKHRVTSREYARVKKEFSQRTSARLKGKPSERRGITHTDEAKKLMSDARKAYFVSHPEVKDALREAKKGNTYARGRKASEEERAHLSQVLKGKRLGIKFTDEHRAAMRENHWLKGKTLPEETRRKGQLTQTKGQILCVETGETFISSREAEAKHHDWHHACITKCCKGLRKTHCGFHFQYLKEQET